MTINRFLTDMKIQFDVIVIGGGRSGLAAGYYLRRSNLSFTVLDMEANPGGSWQQHWESLRLFSPAQRNEAMDFDGVWVVGYGNWTGFASATLIGVGRSAKQTVEEIKAYINAT